MGIGIYIAVGIILVIALIILSRILRKPHREIWDDIQSKELQEDLNKKRIEYGLKPKKIDNKTEAIVK